MEYAIEMLGVTKKFGNFVANDDITLRVKQGEIHALIGENGAGKSTLMNQLFGLLQPTMGSIKINGNVSLIENPNAAAKLGLGMVHQHFQLVDNHTVVENIVLGRENVKTLQPVDFASARRKIIKLSNQYNLDINPDAFIKNMTVGQQQKVEILKMLYSGAKILIFDEPTAMLTPQEIDGLLEMFETFKKSGKTIVFISHKMVEIKEAADSATIIRKGKWVGTVDVNKTSIEKLAEMMVGRKLESIKNNSKKKPGDAPLLSLKSVTAKHFSNPKAFGLKNVTFDVRPGEVVAIAGVEGNGQTELAYAISGIQKPTMGSIELDGKDITRASVKKRITGGMSFLPEDRYKHAMYSNQTLFNNAIMQLFDKKPFSIFGFMTKRKRNEWTRKIIKDFDVRGADNGFSVIKSLSGGNQQKFIAGREMSRDHKLLILFQPTRGLDIGAIEYLHEKILEEKEQGKGILLISYDLNEILSLSDRVVVLSGGDQIQTAETKKVNKEQLGKWMGGAK